MLRDPKLKPFVFKMSKSAPMDPSSSFYFLLFQVKIIYFIFFMIFTLGGKQHLSLEFRSVHQEGNILGTGHLANYSGLVKSWNFEILQLLLY